MSTRSNEITIKGGVVGGSGIDSVAREQLELGKKRDSVISTTATSAIYDNFDKSDSILNGTKSLSGHVWSVSGPGQFIAKVKDGALVSDGTNFYASLSDGNPVKYIQGAFSFHENTGITTGIGDNVVLIMQRADNLSNMIHVILGVSGFNITKRLNGGSFDVVNPVSKSSSVPYNLTSDVVYNTSMSLNGDILTIVDAMGIEYKYVDADFVTINPDHVTIQIGPQPNAQWTGKWHNISSGKKATDQRFLANNGVSKGELVPIRNALDELKGTGKYSGSVFDQSFVYRQRLKDIVISTNGWYTIAKSLLYGGKFIGGKIRINAIDGTGRVTVFEAQVSPKFTDVFNVATLAGNGSVTQIRRRNVSGDIFVDIYFPSATTNPVTFTADFEGFFTVVTPSGIASDTGATPADTKTIAYPAITEVVFDATASGYYALANQVGKSFGYALIGKATIEVSNNSGYAFFDVLFRGTNILTVSNVAKQGVSPVTEMRSTNDGSVNGRLDISLSNAAVGLVTTVRVTFHRYGIYTPVVTPVSGAVALSNVLAAPV